MFPISISEIHRGHVQHVTEGPGGDLYKPYGFLTSYSLVPVINKSGFQMYLSGEPSETRRANVMRDFTGITKSCLPHVILSSVWEINT